tara:strand:+ start:718 stop:900 length:183 start_codon:yes stop_codon:yes gene_type:complete
VIKLNGASQMRGFFLEKEMSFYIWVGCFLLFFVIVWALNIAAKKRYKKKKESSNDIYPLY